MAFAHSGQSHSYTESGIVYICPDQVVTLYTVALIDLQLLSKFSMVQFDKKQNVQVSPEKTQEDRFIAAAQQVKEASEGMGKKPPHILMYINGLINFPAGRLFNLTSDALLLKNSEGKLVKIKGNDVFDMRQPTMRKLFVDDALYGMTSGLQIFSNLNGGSLMGEYIIYART
jgi:hypothetical protein